MFKVILIQCSLITSQDNLVSPYHGLSAELVLIGVEPGTLQLRVDDTTHYQQKQQIDRLHVTRVLNVSKDRAMHFAK